MVSAPLRATEVAPKHEILIVGLAGSGGPRD